MTVIKTSMTKGICFSLMAFFCSAVINVLVKAASPYTSSATMLFFQNLFAFLILLPFVWVRGFDTLKTQNIAMHFLRALTGTGAWYCLFVAISMMPLTNAVLLTYSAPLWMPIMIWITHKKIYSKYVWFSLILGFVGIVLVLHPGGDTFHPAAFIAIGGALLMAFSFLAVRMLSSSESTECILFYYFLFSTILLIPLLLQWQTPTPVAWLYIFGLSVAFILSKALLIFAYQHAFPVRLSPYIYSVIVFTAIFSWLIWGQVPSLLEFTGISIVIIAGILTSVSERFE